MASSWVFPCFGNAGDAYKLRPIFAVGIGKSILELWKVFFKRFGFFFSKSDTNKVVFVLYVIFSKSTSGNVNVEASVLVNSTDGFFFASLSVSFDPQCWNGQCRRLEHGAVPTQNS